MVVEILQNSKKFRNSSVLYHKTKNAFKVKFCKHVSFYCYSYTSWMQKLQRIDNPLDWLLIDFIWKPSILRLHTYLVQCRHSSRDTWKKIVLSQCFLSWVISQKNGVECSWGYLLIIWFPSYDILPSSSDSPISPAVHKWIQKRVDINNSIYIGISNLYCCRVAINSCDNYCYKMRYIEYHRKAVNINYRHGRSSTFEDIHCV